MIVFVLRHAEKQRGVPGSPELVGLTTAGRERAELLARMLEGSGVSVAYHSGVKRAWQTLEPLKRELGAAVEVIPKSPSDTLKILKKDHPPGTVVVVVGHSDSVAEIVNGLHGVPGETIGQLDDSEFDKLFVVFRSPSGETTLLKLRYGAATDKPVT